MDGTPEQIAESIKQSSTGDVVKTVTDLRLEKLESKLSQLDEVMKMNEELRKANAELYALAYAKDTAQNPAVAQVPAPQYASAQAVRDVEAEKARAMREDAMADDVLSQMGYRPKFTVAKTTNQNEMKDGM